MTDATETWTHRTIDTGEVRLHCVEQGKGPLVVLLHGFPEFWYSWRHQIPALADAGFRVVAPDLRGYNLSDKPEGIENYDVAKLAGDVAALIGALHENDAIVVGHDWGAVVAWETAMRFPERVSRLAILNVPHPVTFAHGLRRLEQLRKSWYIGFFQLPRVPERLIASGDFQWIRKMFRADLRDADGSTRGDTEKYVEALKQPGALTAAVNYYRAAVRRSVRDRGERERRRIECPVLILWGDRDRYLGRELADPPARLVPHAKVVHLPDASHWVQVHRPRAVNEHLIAFAKEGVAARATSSSSPASSR